MDTARTNTPAGYPVRRSATSAWPLCICSFGHRALRASSIVFLSSLTRSLSSTPSPPPTYLDSICFGIQSLEGSARSPGPRGGFGFSRARSPCAAPVRGPRACPRVVLNGVVRASEACGWKECMVSLWMHSRCRVGGRGYVEGWWWGGDPAPRRYRATGGWRQPSIV